MSLRRLFIVCVLVVALHSPGWARSDIDAHSLVVLRDRSRENILYSAEAGTVIRIPVDGYDTLSESITEEATAQFPFHERVATPRAFNPHRPRTSLRMTLSDNWVVLEKPSPRAGKSDLLHCRLPQALNAERVKQERMVYVQQNSKAASSAIAHWWRAVSKRHGSGCLYGDGESAVTGTSRYYEVCPLEGIYRVRESALLWRATNHTPKAAAMMAKEESGEGSGLTAADVAPKKPSPVMELLASIHSSHASRGAFRRLQRGQAAFHKIGAYHPVLSRPRWNPKLLVWEMNYPTAQACQEHYSYTTADRGSRQVGEPIGAENPFWRTVIRLRCPSTRRASDIESGRDDPTFWAITEVRQLCQFEVELESLTVCGWEQELDTLNTNPIACVII